MPVRLSLPHFRPARHTISKSALALAACWGLMGTASWADTPASQPAAQAESATPAAGASGASAADSGNAAVADAAVSGAAEQPAGAVAPAVDTAAAERASLEAIKANIKQSFDKRFPGLAVGEAVETPFTGVYEIPVQGELFYVDATGRYVLQGSLIDLETRTDLTAERMARLTAIPFENLPLASAVKQVRGTGERKIAIFEDPNCGYCKQFHRTLERFDDITIYSVMFPILAPDSREKAEHIMCAKDSVATLRAWMLDGKLPPKATCETNIDELLAFGKQHNVRGTPAVFFEDGTRVGGAMNFDQLTRRLADMKKPDVKKP